MSENAENTTLQQLTLFAEDSPVNHIALPGSAEARRMTVISGRKCAVLLKNSGPVGFLLRMCLESEGLSSTACYLTWKPWTTKQGRLLFRLAVLVPHIGENEYGLLPTPIDPSKGGGSSRSHWRRNETPSLQGMARKGMLYPTPSRQEPGWIPGGSVDCVDKNGNPPEHWNQRFYDKNTGRIVQKGLSQVVKMWPTLLTRDRHTYAKVKRGTNSPGGIPLPVAVGGTLNPTWVEWLMGFPLGWTDLEHLETP